MEEKIIEKAKDKCPCGNTLYKGETHDVEGVDYCSEKCTQMKDDMFGEFTLEYHQDQLHKVGYGTKEGEKCNCKDIGNWTACEVHGFKSDEKLDKEILKPGSIIRSNEDSGMEWSEELYVNGIEDLIFHCKMLAACRDKKQGMDDIRNDIEKIESFIRHLLASNTKECDERWREFMKRRDSKMYSYYKSVFEDDFEGGYPIDWDDINLDNK